MFSFQEYFFFFTEGFVHYDFWIKVLLYALQKYTVYCSSHKSCIRVIVCMNCIFFNYIFCTKSECQVIDPNLLYKLNLVFSLTKHFCQESSYYNNILIN